MALSLDSPDGAGGYPAAVKVRARYEALPEGVLSLALEARSDARTLLSLCHHPYFNRDGSEAIEGHRLTSVAKFNLPAGAVPTGEVAGVAGTAFDFTTPRALGTQSCDHSLCLHNAPCGPLAFAAGLWAQRRGPALETWTTQPALHVFDGRVLATRGGVALEAQGWPDSANNPQFPSITLEADTLYRQVTEYRFFN